MAGLVPASFLKKSVDRSHGQKEEIESEKERGGDAKKEAARRLGGCDKNLCGKSREKEQDQSVRAVKGADEIQTRDDENKSQGVPAAKDTDKIQSCKDAGRREVDGEGKTFRFDRRPERNSEALLHYNRDRLSEWRAAYRACL